MMLGACAKTVQNQEIPAATYMGGNDTITGVCKDLDSAGASHVDTFQEWVANFADSAGKNAQLQDAWSDPKELKADVGSCMDGWEQNHDYSDADCRMTAFLLLDGILRAESTEENYEGTYLMFDTEAIDNVDRYSILKEKRDMFTTLYGEKSVTDDKHPEAAFSDSWKQYGFTVDSDRISLQINHFGKVGFQNHFFFKNAKILRNLVTSGPVLRFFLCHQTFLYHFCRHIII